MKHYKIKACLSCRFFDRCAKNKAGRLIERTEHADLIEANKQRIAQNKELYRKRQAIVEHPFGIIKRQWDFYYIMTKKTIRHASADVGLIFTAFNLRRIFNSIDLKVLKDYLSTLAALFVRMISKFKPLYDLLSSAMINSKSQNRCFLMPANRLYLIGSTPV